MIKSVLLIVVCVVAIACSTNVGKQKVVTRTLENGNTMIEVHYGRYIYLYQIEGYHNNLTEEEKIEHLVSLKKYVEDNL
jgi:hypothetical protein